MSQLPISTREALTNVWLAGPATLAMLVFIFFPVVIVAVLSFTDYQFGARSFAWVGIENYQKLFGSDLGMRALTNTLLYVAIVIPGSVALGLLVALGLHRMVAWAPGLSNALRA
ncbi:MAG: sugar ABC transporter permease, partial [bacterium]|nr:sugar ABC transporter permease [bacterium]